MTNLSIATDSNANTSEFDAITIEIVSALKQRDAIRSAERLPLPVALIGHRMGLDAADSSALAWFLLQRAVTTPESASLKPRPLMAAKHLLALIPSDYPDSVDDVIPDAAASYRELCIGPRSQLPPKDLEHRLTQRIAIAAAAGGYGGRRYAFRGDRRDLQVIAKTLLLNIVDQMVTLANLEKLPVASDEHGAATNVDPSPAGRTTNAGKEPGQRKLAKKRRRAADRRRQRIQRVITLSSCALIALMLASLVLGPALLYFSSRSVQNVDPLSRASSSGVWEAGWGPTHRSVTSADTPQLNVPSLRPSLYGAIGPDRPEDNFLSASPPFFPAAWIGAGAGTYSFTATVQYDSAVQPGHQRAEAVSGARISLGVIPASSIDKYSVYARVTSDGVGPIWSGDAVRVNCACSVAIDPSSVRIVSEQQPRGVSLGPDVLSPQGALIGYAGRDGRIPFGSHYLVEVEGQVRISVMNGF